MIISYKQTIIGYEYTQAAAGVQGSLIITCIIIQNLLNIIRTTYLVSIPDIGIGRVKYWIHTALPMPQAFIIIIDVRWNLE